MSTRGILGFVVNGKLKVGYNHADSYPGWLGVKARDFVAEMVEGGPEAIAEVKARAEALTLIEDEGSPVSPDQAEAVSQWSRSREPRCRQPEGWYELLQGTQGDPGAMLACGYVLDSQDFALDSLFCEWGYLIDLDAEALEVYEGFRTQVTTEGRWAAAQIDSETDARRRSSPGESYYPIQRIAAFPFAELPDGGEFLAKVQEASHRAQPAV